jgi:acetyl esterase/lipase
LLAAGCLVLASLGAASANAAEAGAGAEALRDRAWMNLWPGKAPGALGDSDEDTPAVQVFLPAQPTGAAIIVCPGGGYGGRAAHEAGVVGEWLAKHGVTGFVLRYRVGPKGYHHPVEMNDAARAIRFVRAHAEPWRLDPKRIGILGFSAGGHLASTIATHPDDGDAKAADPVDRASSRPDVQILIYPVITMGPTGHSGSRVNLFGKEKANDAALIELLSNERHVDAHTPPAFVVHAVEDKAVPVSNSDEYVAALKKAGVEVEYVRPEKGPHGFGLKEFWTEPCVAWLGKLKFANPAGDAAPAK